MVQKVFNFNGTEEEYQSFRNNVGNVSSFITSVIRNKLPKGESAVVSLCKTKLDFSLKELDNHYTQIDVLKNEIESLKYKIQDEEEKHKLQTEKDAINYARDKIKIIKGSVESEYKYIKAMKEANFTGTLDDFLKKEYYDFLE